MINQVSNTGFVEREVFMKYIRRSIEDVVLKSDETFKSILVTGARQTGKSTMLRKLFPDRKYVPVDDPFIEEQAKEQPGMFMMLNPPPVIYDEVLCISCRISRCSCL